MTRTLFRRFGAGCWLVPVLALAFVPARAHSMPFPWDVIVMELARQELFPVSDEASPAPSPEEPSALAKAEAEVQRLGSLLKAERDRSAVLEKQLRKAHKEMARLEKEAGKVCQAAHAEKVPAREADNGKTAAELQRQVTEMRQQMESLRQEVEGLRQQVQQRPLQSPYPYPYGNPPPVPGYPGQPLTPPGGNGPYYQAPVVPLNEVPSGGPDVERR